MCTRHSLSHVSQVVDVVVGIAMVLHCFHQLVRRSHERSARGRQMRPRDEESVERLVDGCKMGLRDHLQTVREHNVCDVIPPPRPADGTSRWLPVC